MPKIVILTCKIIYWENKYKKQRKKHIPKSHEPIKKRFNDHIKSWDKIIIRPKRHFIFVCNFSSCKIILRIYPVFR